MSTKTPDPSNDTIGVLYKGVDERRAVTRAGVEVTFLPNKIARVPRELAERLHASAPDLFVVDGGK